jgi:predicted DNA binding CopG/RHH family protein
MRQEHKRDKAAKAGRSTALPRPPDFASDEEEAAWLESEAGQRFMEQAPLQPTRFAPKDPSLTPVTIRLPKGLRHRIRKLAAERGMGYQTLARQWLIERCREEEENETTRSRGKNRRRTA